MTSRRLYDVIIIFCSLIGSEICQVGSETRCDMTQLMTSQSCEKMMCLKGDVIGSRCFFTCCPGYKSIKTTLCQSNGQWSTTGPFCESENQLRISDVIVTSYLHRNQSL